MISYHSETDFDFQNPENCSNWISGIIISEGYEEGEISYIFCDDDYLHKINVEFLSHDTLTDIISFDNCIGKLLNGDIYISIERVRANAITYKNNFETELHRVMIHGILHYCGYKDKTKEERLLMRSKEESSLKARKII